MKERVEEWDARHASIDRLQRVQDRVAWFMRRSWLALGSLGWSGRDAVWLDPARSRRGLRCLLAGVATDVGCTFCRRLGAC